MQPRADHSTTTQTPPRQNPLDYEPRRKMWGCLLLLMVGLHVGIGPKIKLSEWEVQRASNSAFDEALQWRRGTMALSDANPKWEAPLVDGKSYNVVGPAFVLMAIVGTSVSEWVGAEPNSFYGPFYMLMVAGPLLLVSFATFRSITRSAAWGAVITAYLIAGTSLRPVLTMCRLGSIYYIDHVLAVTGLLLLAGDLLGQRRIWPSVIGLALAVWSRQMTCFYALPLIWLAVAKRPTDEQKLVVTSLASTAAVNAHIRRKRGIMVALVGVAIIAALPMTLSYIKFGNPIESGYAGMYHSRDDKIARDARECFWGPRWYERHIRAMNLTIPKVDFRSNALQFIHVDQEGGSIWFTCPILLAIFLTVRQWWRDPPRRALMLTTIPVLLGIWGYHTMDAQQCGYYRYALDVVPIWFAVIARFITTRNAAPWTLGCMAWSIFYYHTLVP